MIADEFTLFLGEPARRGRRFQASQKPHSRTNVGKRCPPPPRRRAIRYNVFCQSVPYVRMIIRTYNPLSNNILQSETGKKHFHYYPSRNPRRARRVQTFLLPPPERFPMSGFAPEGAELENGGAFPYRAFVPIGTSSHRPFIGFHRVIAHSSPIHRSFVTHSSPIHRSFITHSSVFVVSSLIPSTTNY